MSNVNPLNNSGRPRKKIRLGELLVREKLISEDQLSRALTQQKASGGQLGRVLVEQKAVEEAQIMRVLSEQLLIPVIDLRQAQFEPELVRLLPEPHARRYRAIVLRRDEDSLVVGMVDPTDLFAQDSIAALLAQPIKLVLVREAELVQAIETVYRRTEEIVTLAGELDQEMARSDGGVMESEELAAEDAPVVRLLQSVFEDAVQVRASDIHIEPEAGLVRVRQRVDGILHEQVINETRVATAMVTRLKLLSGLDIAEKRLPQDGRFQMRVRGHTIDVRLSTMPVQHGESVVMRLLYPSATVLSLPQLNLPATMLTSLRRMIVRPHGLLLVTGPTGSGKTTTLYAALNEINAPQRKIVTVEDPVEYRLPRINQVQVHAKIELTFARILRSALRQDPDIIMVGEMRDAETAEIGIRAAMTGHFVLSTLHTNDSISSVSRLIDMGIPGYMIATALSAVIAQRLVRRVCDNCAQPVALDPGEQAWVQAMGGDLLKHGSFRCGTGCQYCNRTGYRGRIGLYEMLEMDAALVDLLRAERYRDFEIAAARAPGFKPLARLGLDYAAQGLTTVSEVIRIAGEVEPAAPVR